MENPYELDPNNQFSDPLLLTEGPLLFDKHFFLLWK